MEQKYIIIGLPILFILVYGAYWYWHKKQPLKEYYSAPITQLARDNNNYRQVVYRTDKTELTLMAVPVAEQIPTETHAVDQLFIIVDGKAEAHLKGDTVTVTSGSVLIVPAGTEHTVKNVGTEPLKLYTIYAPPEHPVGTLHKTRADEPKKR